MKYILAPLLFINCWVSIAQDFNNYEPIMCAGPLPKDFTDRTSDKVLKDIEKNTDKTENHIEAKSKNNFILKSNYMLDELLMSGRVLFGDPVSEYVNTVADKLLKDEPKLRKELRFYCIKSNITNAFSTNQGMIFVTLGLIAQLENEAQLAQVLSHEIVHYTKKHVINTFLESSKISKGNGKYKYSSYDDNIIKLSNYSKTLEFEADSLGFFRLKNAGYAIQEALSVFDVLQFSYLPFDERPFQYDFFETETVKIPEAFRLDTILPIRFEDDYDDSKSTHPNIRKRRDQIIRLIENEKGGQLFIQKEELFHKIQTICRFEGVRLNTKNAAYVKSIYNAQLLLADYPNSIFLKKNILKALYGISKYKNQEKYYMITNDYDEYEGEISAAYYFFEKLSSEQVTSITLEKINAFYLEHNKNKRSQQQIASLIDDLVDDDFKFENYHERIIADTLTVKETTPKVDTTTTKRSGKYAKLRAKKEQQEQEEKIVKSEDLTQEFHLQYLYNAPNVKELNKWFEVAKVAKEKRDAIADSIDQLTYYQKRTAERKAAKIYDKVAYKNANIKTNKIVFVDPDYFIVDERKGQKLENAEEKRYDFYQQVDMVAHKAGIEYEILSPKVFNANDTDKYNDLARMNDWVGEKMMHEDFKEEWNIIPSESEYVSYLKDEYNTDIFLYTGILQYKEKRKNVGSVLTTTILFYPLLPYGIYYAATPINYTYYYNLFYDISEDKKLLDKVKVLKVKSSQGVINSSMYDMLTQIKK
ncbi:MAG: M48 family metallopeptidase [Flavobacteriales bacterium]|jgi:hypothetical protein|nr:M48 family metallopeptidase [Flavobacteriales bacterium]